MSRRNKASAASPTTPTLCWRHWISAPMRDLWIEQIGAMAGLSWAVTERPDRARILIEVYARDRAVINLLKRRHGGRIRAINAREWNRLPAGNPIHIGKRLVISHEQPRAGEKSPVPRLYIPHGLAFGSGEHATTRMLLQALIRHVAWPETSVLDLGTGSGILAMAARRLGARRIVATDFDAEAIRTARQNEELNFSTPLVRWRCADVKRLLPTPPHDLVVANLFSGILCEAAPQLSRAIASGGMLWLSGVLRSQQDQVVAAYRRRRLELVRIVTRGKWVMLQWARR